MSGVPFCRLLAGLSQSWQVKQPLLLEDVVELLWPDESIMVEAAANRVYKTMSLLRKQGLGQVLLGGAEGYRIDPAIKVVVVPEKLHWTDLWGDPT